MNDVTFVEAMRRSATVSATRGVRFYSDENTSSRLTYAELDARARARSAALQARGFGPGDVAVLGFEPGFGFIESVYAALYTGMTIAPVPVTVGRNPRTVVERIEAIVADSGSRLVLTDPGARPLFDGADLPPQVEVALLADPEPALADAWVPPVITADSIALLQYTSGSTGVPKGVVVSHGNLVANEEAIGAAVADSAESVWVGWLPHYHDMGLIGLLFRPIFVGADSVLTAPSRFLRRPLFWLRLITRHRGTFTVAPDFAYRLCAQVVTDEQLAELDLSSLRHIVTGAEPIRMTTVNEFADRFATAGLDPAAFVPAYGMAETTLIIAASAGREVRAFSADLAALEAGSLVAAAGSPSVELVSCGPPVPGSTVAIVDPETGAALPEGSVGEIWVSGPSVTQGYWGRPAETAEAYGFTLASTPGVFLRTGDLGALSDGEIIVAGRLKDLIISHGRNIFPQDVESLASRLVGDTPGCLSAAFSLEHQPSEVGIAVEVEPRVLSQTDLPALTADIRKALVAEFGLPSIGIALVRKGILPRTTSGKIQRRRVRRDLIEGGLSYAHSDGLSIGVRASEERTPVA